MNVKSQFPRQTKRQERMGEGRGMEGIWLVGRGREDYSLSGFTFDASHFAVFSCQSFCNS